MEMLATVFQGLLDLGAAVFLPIVLFIIGLIVGMKPGKAFSSALTLGVAFIGINLLIGYMGDTVGAAFTTIVEGSDSTLKYIDMGWAPALGLAWQWQYAFLMFPIQIAIKFIMLLLGWTNCLNVDMWNVGNKVFTAFLVTSACNNVIVGFIVAIVQIIAELKNADYTKYQILELTGVPSVGMPHCMFLSNIFFYPIANILDKILPNTKTLNAQEIRNKIGIFGENHVLGFLMGTIIGLAAGQGSGALLLGVQAGTALTLFPMVSKLFMTALTPISDAASEWVKKKFPGRELIIGLDWPILAGNSEIWVAIILTIPVALIFSLILPGNTALVLGNLMNVCVCVPLFLAMKGDVLKMCIVSWIWCPILSYAASVMGPLLTNLANTAGTYNTDITWWGCDIAEIRFAIYEAATGNMFGIVACVAVVALGILYFLKLAPAREKAAKERLESGQ